MTNPENRLSCHLDSMPDSEREQQRLAILTEMGLLEAESVPIFEEATQTAAHSLNAPICILGLIDRDRQWFKSAIGLSRIGLMNSLESSRQLPREEAFCTHVVDSHQTLAIHDTLNHPAFAHRLLVQQYGIRAYLGVPLLMSTGNCLGTLAIMELAPRDFTTQEIEFLELIARWSMSEFERHHLLKQPQPAQQPIELQPAQPIANDALKPSLPHPLANSVKVNLIAQMTQELCTPLTSILGMASVLSREIYGPLTDKQKEYIDIVHHSGQYLLSLVNEILELGALDDSNQGLSLAPVDVEMLCQQVINTLKQVAQRRDQQLRLTVEPGHRIWLLDKEKVRQMVYHLVFGIIQSASTESILRIHVSRKPNQLIIKIWTSHPWLGDGLPQAELHSNELLSPKGKEAKLVRSDRLPGIELEKILDPVNHKVSSSRTDNSESAFGQPHRANSRHSLGLRLSRQLAELHGGQIGLQGSAEAGYRYVITLPQLTETGESA